MFTQLPIECGELLRLIIKTCEVIEIHGCDYTLRNVRYYLSDHPDADEIMNWLKENNIICDCKALAFMSVISSQLNKIYFEQEKSEKVYTFNDDVIKFFSDSFNKSKEMIYSFKDLRHSKHINNKQKGTDF